MLGKSRYKLSWSGAQISSPVKLNFLISLSLTLSLFHFNSLQDLTSLAEFDETRSRASTQFSLSLRVSCLSFPGSLCYVFYVSRDEAICTLIALVLQLGFSLLQNSISIEVETLSWICFLLTRPRKWM